MDSCALHTLSSGMFILSAFDGKKDNGCIINTALWAASTPNRLSICVLKKNYTHNMILNSERFTVSVIDKSADFELIKRFGFSSGAQTDKFSGFSACKRSKNGDLYVTASTNAFISAKTDLKIDLGSHSMFIGEITDMQRLSNAPSLTYDEYITEIKPTAQKKDEGSKKSLWRCRVCGFEYEGDKLPDGYICPLCGHPAEDFERV